MIPQTQIDPKAAEEYVRTALQQMRYISHDDLDDAYAGRCEVCGSRLLYDRRLPRGQRVLSCMNNCPVEGVDTNDTK